MTLTIRAEDAEESKGTMESLRVHATDVALSSPATTAAAPGAAAGRPSTPAGRRALAAEGVFECKTCSKRFPSFQALGGHRTSHTRLQARLLLDELPAAAGAAAERDRARHECVVCGLEFSMGQALGGHMRRHRGEPAPASSSGAAPADDAEQQETMPMPDLNYPPEEDGGDGGQESSTDHGASEPRLLNLLV